MTYIWSYDWKDSTVVAQFLISIGEQYILKKNILFVSINIELFLDSSCPIL
jgi:hypothetical protein